MFVDPYLLIVLQVAGQSPLCSSLQLKHIPHNKAVVKNSKAQFNCSTDVATDALEWKFIPQSGVGGGTGTTIWLSKDGGQPSDSRFGIKEYEHHDNFHYDLIIVNAEMEMAGEYTCELLGFQDSLPYKSSAHLVVLSDLKCEPLVSGPPVEPRTTSPAVQPIARAVLEGEMMTFRCQVQTAGYREPDIEWWGEDGFMAAQYYFHQDTGIGELTVSMKATVDHDAQPFQCRLGFFPKNDDIVAPPSYKDTCISYYYVSHSPRDFKIHPSPDVDQEDETVMLNLGQRLTCSARGRPVPDYTWIDGVTGRFIEGNTLIITKEIANRQLRPISWTCRATNIVDREMHTVDKVVKMLIRPVSCDPNPCRNRATCVEGWERLSCNCEDMYEGPLCEDEIDPCEQKPCLNGGECVPDFPSYTCKCQARFTGKNCDEAADIDACDSNPCLNGGECIDGSFSFTCACVEGYEGDRCQSAISSTNATVEILNGSDAQGQSSGGTDIEFISVLIGGLIGAVLVINILAVAAIVHTIRQKKRSSNEFKATP